MDGRVPSMPSTFGYSFEAIESIPNLKIDIYRYLNSPDLIQIYSKVLFPGQFKPIGARIAIGGGLGLAFQNQSSAVQITAGSRYLSTEITEA